MADQNRIAELGTGLRFIVIAFIGVAIGVSTTFLLSLSIFIKPISEEFGWGRGTVSMAPLMVNLTLAALSTQVGRLVDRFGSMPVAVTSTAAYAVALAALSFFAADFWSFFGIVLVMAIVCAGSAPLPYTKLLVTAFDRGRGMALGIALSGTGVGSALISAFLAPRVEADGWRGGYLALSLCVATGLLLMTLLWMTAPPRLKERLLMDRASAAGEPLAAGAPALPLSRDRNFWLLGLSFFLAAVGVLTLVAHFIPMLTDAGMTLGDAGRLAGGIGVAMIAGRVITGVLLDHIKAEALGAALFSIAACGMMLLALGGKGFALPAALIAGFGVGAEVDVMAYLAGKYFGVKRYGAAYGGLYAMFIVGTSVGPAIAGFLFDWTGTYTHALLLATACLLAAAIVLILLPGPVRSMSAVPDERLA